MPRSPRRDISESACRRHEVAAMRLLNIRDRDHPSAPIDQFQLDVAAGHLRAVQRHTGETPPEICARLHITGLRRQRVMPTRADAQYRFRMPPRQRIDARNRHRWYTIGGKLVRQTDTHPDAARIQTNIAAREAKLIARRAAILAALDDPLAP